MHGGKIEKLGVGYEISMPFHCARKVVPMQKAMKSMATGNGPFFRNWERFAENAQFIICRKITN